MNRLEVFASIPQWYMNLHLDELAEWVVANVSRRAVNFPKDQTLQTEEEHQLEMYVKTVVGAQI